MISAAVYGIGFIHKADNVLRTGACMHMIHIQSCCHSCVKRYIRLCGDAITLCTICFSEMDVRFFCIYGHYTLHMYTDICMHWIFACFTIRISMHRGLGWYHVSRCDPQSSSFSTILFTNADTCMHAYTPYTPLSCSCGERVARGSQVHYL